MIVGIYILQRVLSGLSGQFPFLQYVLYFVVFLVYMTWITEPLFNLALRLDPIARHALNDDEKKASTVVGIGLLILVGSLLTFAFTGIDFFALLAIVSAGILLPACKYYTTQRPDLKQKTGWYAVGMIVVGGLLLLTGIEGLMNLFVLGFIGFQILYNVWSMSRRGLV